MRTITHFVGLDVHKDTIVIAVAPAEGGEPRCLGTIPNDWTKLRNRLRKIGAVDSLAVCYEAGPMGYPLHRRLVGEGIEACVIAPSLIPRAPGDRVKTDRRDALALARFFRSGDLTPVRVPDEQTEAVRDLTRAREDAKAAERTVRLQLNHFLLRHNHPYRKTRWSKMHIEWIRKIHFEDGTLNRVLCDALRAVELAGERVAQLTQDMADILEEDEWQYSILAKSLMALRGVSVVTATILAAELGDLRRFASAPQMMSFLGLVPSEHTSGGRERRGRITRTGNAHVRRVLVESAWAYTHRARMSREIAARNEGLPQAVRDIAWKAQTRLCNKYRKMSHHRKHKCKIAVAIARELVGFIWAIGQEVFSSDDPAMASS